MEVEFLEQFSKDLDAIRQKSVKSGLAKLIDRGSVPYMLSDAPTQYSIRITLYVLLKFLLLKSNNYTIAHEKSPYPLSH
jgi:hypothetical protein